MIDTGVLPEASWRYVGVMHDIVQYSERFHMFSTTSFKTIEISHQILFYNKYFIFWVKCNLKNT